MQRVRFFYGVQSTNSIVYCFEIENCKKLNCKILNVGSINKKL